MRKITIWVAVDSDGTEFIYDSKPIERNRGKWICNGHCIKIPNGTIKKIIGWNLRRYDTPIEVKNKQYK